MSGAEARAARRQCPAAACVRACRIPPPLGPRLFKHPHRRGRDTAWPGSALLFDWRGEGAGRRQAAGSRPPCISQQLLPAVQCSLPHPGALSFVLWRALELHMVRGKLKELEGLMGAACGIRLASRRRAETEPSAPAQGVAWACAAGLLAPGPARRAPAAPPLPLRAAPAGGVLRAAGPSAAAPERMRQRRSRSTPPTHPTSRCPACSSWRQGRGEWARCA